MGILANYTQVEETEDIAIDRFMKSNMLKGDNHCIPNLIYKKSEVDLLQITNDGYAHEYEFKVNQTGIKYDLHKRTIGEFKPKHKENIAGNRVNYYTFVIPKRLNKPHILQDIPQEYGIIFFEVKSKIYVFSLHRESKLLREEKVSTNDLLETIFRAGVKLRKVQREAKYWKDYAIRLYKLLTPTNK